MALHEIKLDDAVDPALKIDYASEQWVTIF